MPRKPQADPAALDRLRRARAAEDDAVTAVTSAQAAVDSAMDKRRLALAALDVGVADVQARLNAARGALVEAAGLDRAALILGMGAAELRRTTAAKSGGATHTRAAHTGGEQLPARSGGAR
jgi:hypothetical protein